MRVLHITTIDTGGAYKAALRIHESMQCCGISSKLMVRTRLCVDSPVIEANAGFWKKNVSRGKNALNLLVKRGEVHGDRWGTDLCHNEHVKNADVIVLHWINSFLSLSDIAKLCKLGKPVVWVLHDMWIFTGGCHYDRYCGKYEEICGCCPVIGSNKPKDITWRNFCRKRIVLRDLPLTVVGPSRWILACAEKSRILNQKKMNHIPNALDTEKFAPISDIDFLRNKYKIRSDRKVILFGAADQGTENPMKGFSYLVQALQKLSPQEYMLVIFGNIGSNLVDLEKFDVCGMGYISDENKLREIYCLADVFVNPSLQEVFGYTVCEAMACGTPAAAFAVGGNKEQIAHMENGYLARYKDIEDLAEGIAYCAHNTLKLGEKACAAAQQYSYESVGRKYEGLLLSL